MAGQAGFEPNLETVLEFSKRKMPINPISLGSKVTKNLSFGKAARNLKELRVLIVTGIPGIKDMLPLPHVQDFSLLHNSKKVGVASATNTDKHIDVVSLHDLEKTRRQLECVLILGSHHSLIITRKGRLSRPHLLKISAF